MKSESFKGPPQNRSYKTFDAENFDTALQKSLHAVINNTCSEFVKAFLNVLHDNEITKIPQHINHVFMTKELRKKIVGKFLYLSDRSFFFFTAKYVIL